MGVRERERERDSHRKRERVRERERERVRERERLRERERVIEKERESERDRERDRESQRERERESHREREREREREEREREQPVEVDVWFLELETVVLPPKPVKSVIKGTTDEGKVYPWGHSSVRGPFVSSVPSQHLRTPVKCLSRLRVHTTRSGRKTALRTLKIPCPPIHKRRRNEGEDYS